jgi:hypothetical protein
MILPCAFASQNKRIQLHSRTKAIINPNGEYELWNRIPITPSDNPDKDGEQGLLDIPVRVNLIEEIGDVAT